MNGDDANDRRNLELDPRFPSGPWSGYYVEPG
jgi:hypothetical protein